MMQCSFLLEWGEWTGYYAQPDQPRLDFSGGFKLENGRVIGTERILYPEDAWGPFVFSRRFAPYGRSEWESVLQNWFDGLRVSCEGESTTCVSVCTRQGRLRFTLGELQKKGEVGVCTGAPCTLAQLRAVWCGDPPYYEAPAEKGALMLHGAAFRGPQGDFFSVHGLVLAPGRSARAKAVLPWPAAHSGEESGLRGTVRFLISASPERELHALGMPRFSLYADRTEIFRNCQFTAWHDTNSQFLEEVPFEVPPTLREHGTVSLELRNEDNVLTVIVASLRFQPRLRRHMEILRCPRWAVAGRPFTVVIRCLTGAALTLAYDPALLEPAMPAVPDEYTGAGSRPPDEIAMLPRGVHEFYFRPKKSFQNAVIRFIDDWTGAVGRACIAQCWPAAPAQALPVHIGVECRTGNPREYAPLVRRTLHDQLGDMIVFRDYHNGFTGWQELWQAAADCRRYGLYTDEICMADERIVAAASAEHCLQAGGHECTGIFYGARPAEGRCRTQKQAQAESVALLRTVAEGYRLTGIPVATGDASGGSREAYMAGFDVLRHETFVGHHALILPNARGCARAFGKKRWGVHMATQHNTQPEGAPGLRRYALGYALAWVSGAEFLYEEDSLFACSQYCRMVGDDWIPREKQRLCAEFYRYSAVHPRMGAPAVDIAVLQGRYAPPFTGISTTNFGPQPPAPVPVWGMAGCNAPSWRFRQPEKGWHLLEGLAPGISLAPLRQDTARVRRFFSGDPQGEFDLTPIEAPQKVLASYQLLLLLGWHTMEAGDENKLLACVRGGSVLFLAVPQLTTRSDRDMLDAMEDLSLSEKGEIQALCGVRVRGKSQTLFSAPKGCGAFAGRRFTGNRRLRLPDAPDADGPCALADIDLCGAEPVVVDRTSNLPLVVCRRAGRGYVYLLCTWAWPGHEALADFMPALLDAIRERHLRRKTEVHDPSGYIYWSNWKLRDGQGKLYLLNTDWSMPHGRHTATVQAGGCRFSQQVREGSITEICYAEGQTLQLKGRHAALVQEDTQDRPTWRAAGFGKTALTVHAAMPLHLTVGETVHALGAGVHCLPLALCGEAVCITAEKNLSAL